MWIRFFSAVISAIVLFVTIFLSAATFYILVFAVAMLGLFEYFRAMKTAGHKPFIIIGYIVSIVAFLIAGSHIFLELKLESNYISFYIIGTLLLMLTYALSKPEKYNFVDLSVTVFGIIYVTILILYVILIRSLDNGTFLLLLMFVGIFASDSSALFAGKLFGKHQLIAKVSPKKTVEGSIGCIIGGTVFTVICGMLLSYTNINIPFYHLVIVGLMISIVAQFGDLMASSIKRQCGIKDFGTIMPGHGGALDRIDSILFVAPLFYFYVTTFLTEYIK